MAISPQSPVYAVLKTRLGELDAERREILKVLGNPSARKPARRRRGMSAAARKAASERMRKYWAARKKSGK